jgi:transposase-like protein
MTIMQERAERLKERLVQERAKYDTDADMAEAIGGVKPGTLNKWIRKGPAVWPESHLQAICDYFGQSLDELTAPEEKKVVNGGKVIRMATAESSGNYSVATFETAKKIFDRLPAEDKKKFAIYSVQSIAV